MIYLFWWQKFAILLQKKSLSQHAHGNFLENFQKHCHIFKEEYYEIVKIFREFGQISSFLILKSPHLANRF